MGSRCHVSHARHVRHVRCRPGNLQSRIDGRLIHFVKTRCTKPEKESPRTEAHITIYILNIATRYEYIQVKVKIQIISIQHVLTKQCY